MPNSVIAAQLYTVRQFTRTPADIAATLKRVKQIGYDVVQTSALGPIDPKDLAGILRGEGLVCCATHISFERMRDQTDAVIEEHRILNCQYPAIGSMPGTYPRSADGFARFARDASEVARKLAAAGLTFGYHNHSFELEKYHGRTGLDILREQSDSKAFTFEVDTYWIQHGGGDPAAWIRKLAGRMPLVHLKDMVVGVDKTAAPVRRFVDEADADYQKRVERGRSPQPMMAEVGEGNMNWPAILDACRAAGVRWYIVEQDVCQRDPFESLATSLRNLKALGLN
jgi:sugar phosphate isomerase/epimerase